MKIVVTNCGDCPFLESDYNADTSGYDTLASCGLLRKQSGLRKFIIASYDSWVEGLPKELETILSNCPLQDDEITIKLK